MASAPPAKTTAAGVCANGSVQGVALVTWSRPVPVI